MSKTWKLEMLAKASKIVFEDTDPTPEWLVSVMTKENGYNPKLIIKRNFYKSDLDKVQASLSIPFNQIANHDFLTQEEAAAIDKQLKRSECGVSVVLIDPLCNKHDVELRKRSMNGVFKYVLCNGWYNVVTKNSFGVGDVTHIWSFRCGPLGQLCIALSPLVKSD
ncbi:unnamed protein product [Cochlearia groenlandica]